MTALRLLPLFALIALLVAPFGRMGIAEAAGMDHHAAPMAMAMSGHCEDMPMPEPGKPNNAAIDCMVACAAVAPALPPQIAGFASLEAPLTPTTLIAFQGIHPEADPPPPRRS